MLLQKFKKKLSEGHEAKYQLLPLIGNISPFRHRQLVILIINKITLSEVQRIIY